MHNRDFTRDITFRMDCEGQLCRSSRHFTAPPGSISRWTPEHICSLCGKHRSLRYRKLHPLAPGQTPEPGICSRPKCATAVNEMLLRLPCRPVVYEINHHHYHHHHHHHSSAGLEEPPPGYTAAEARLPDNTPHLTRHSSRDLSPIREELSSINISSEPEELPPNCTAAELSGESSLTGRIELPDNRLYLGRHFFRRLSQIPEEPPPPVNFLNKPTLQKKKGAL
jgi:hypothetical protein